VGDGVGPRCAGNRARGALLQREVWSFVGAHPVGDRVGQRCAGIRAVGAHPVGDGLRWYGAMLLAHQIQAASQWGYAPTE